MPNELAEWIIRIPVLLFSITIHEFSHGKAALSLGDPTAKKAGRLTLNPIPHIDPLGAICLFLFHFGWAKPVPVNVRYFQNIRRDTILMALSGPLANLSAAFVAGIFIRYFYLSIDWYLFALFYLLIMNIGLGLFNLIPIPPLDGSHVLENLLRGRAAEGYRRFHRYGVMVLFGIILLDNFAHTAILQKVLLSPMLSLARLFAGDNLLRILSHIG